MSRVKYNFIILTCFLCSTLTTITTAGQEKKMRNEIYLEALGNGGWGSLNYERKLRKSQLYGLRIGAGLRGTYEVIQPTIITAFSYLIPLEQQNLFLETSPGLTIGFNSPYDDGSLTLNTVYLTDYILTFTLGFRKYTKGNWLYRFTLVPGFVMNNGSRFIFTGGISFGKRF